MGKIDIGDIRYVVKTGCSWKDAKVVETIISEIADVRSKRVKYSFVHLISNEKNVFYDERVPIEELEKSTYTTRAAADDFRKEFMKFEAEFEIARIKSFLQKEGIEYGGG